MRLWLLTEKGTYNFYITIKDKIACPFDFFNLALYKGSLINIPSTVLQALYSIWPSVYVFIFSLIIEVNLTLLPSSFRYVALNMLMRAVTADAQAVQRHRATIIECVKVLDFSSSLLICWQRWALFYYPRSWSLDSSLQDSDASIRKRALDLVYVLVNETNVKPLVKELIDYLEVSDHDFRGDLTAKICSIVAKWVIRF